MTEALAPRPGFRVLIGVFIGGGALTALVCLTPGILPAEVVAILMGISALQAPSFSP